VVPHNTLQAEIHWLWVFQLAMCYAVPQPVYFTWQCVMRYHNQCPSPDNVSCGTTTSAFHLAMCHAVPRPVQPSNMSYGTTTSVFHLGMSHTVPQPVYFSWQCVMRYHNQCISPGNVLCGTATSVFHLAMCYAVPEPVPFT
jgi:starvation-inducible outer membrane lipoprotein